MRLFSDRPATRWAVPILAVVAIATGASLVTVSASADPNLPDRTPAQLLVDVRGATLHTGSGTVVQTSDLGLPELPGLTTGTGGSTPMTSLLGGSHTWRVWYAGPTKARVALVGSIGETDVIRNGSDAWVWDSTRKEAVHYTLPDGHTGGPLPTALASQLPMTPDEAAAKALAAIEPTTTVTTAKNVMVAGRPAYELVLTPKGSGSLVASVHIAVDGALYVPLRVQVYSTKRTNPAFEVGFTQVGFDTPEDRQFAFVAPPDTSVRNGELPSMAAPAAGMPTLPLGPGGALPAGLKIVGSAWSTVLVVTAAPPAASDTAQGTDSLSHLLASLPRVSGSWGSGHLLEGTLFSAVVADDGRIAFGPVGPDLLYAALSSAGRS